jgi:CheY-like chemotaxis protein
MPIMNGYESTAAIRKLPNAADVPIIALTAGTVVGEKEKCIEHGMNDYIPKPIDKELLAKIVRDLMKFN